MMLPYFVVYHRRRCYMVVRHTMLDYIKSWNAIVVQVTLYDIMVVTTFRRAVLLDAPLYLTTTYHIALYSLQLYNIALSY